MSKDDKVALLAELEVARTNIAEKGALLRASGEAVKRRFDVAERAKESFKKNRPVWLGGAAILGLMFSKVSSRKKSDPGAQSTGSGGNLVTLLTVLKFAGGLAKPFLGDLAAKWLASRMESTFPPKDTPK